MSLPAHPDDIDLIEQGKLPPGAVLVDGSGRGPEARIPRSWMRCPRVLSAPDKCFRVWVLLWSYADPSGASCFPSIDSIAAGTGKSRRGVFRALAKLVELGLLTKDKPAGGWASTRYTLMDPTTL